MGQVCQRWKIPKAAQGGKGRGGGSKGQLDRVCAFLCKKYPLIFCGRFEMTWKQIGYAQRLSPDIRIIRNRVHKCLMNAILKCFLDHFCRDLAYFGRSCMHISRSFYRPQHFTIVFAEIQLILAGPASFESLNRPQIHQLTSIYFNSIR